MRMPKLWKSPHESMTLNSLDSLFFAIDWSFPHFMDVTMVGFHPTLVVGFEASSNYWRRETMVGSSEIFLVVEFLYL